MFLYLPFIIIFIIIISVKVIKMMSTLNNTVQTINFQGNLVRITSFKILWLKSKIFSVPVSDITCIKSVFEGYGINHPEGIKLTVGKKNNLNLVKIFFDDYEEIIEHFMINGKK